MKKHFSSVLAIVLLVWVIIPPSAFYRWSGPQRVFFVVIMLASAGFFYWLNERI